MDALPADERIAQVAAAIADPARARMLCCLLDGCARTATELAVVAGIGASTASSHFQRLRDQGLVSLTVQGKHRYFQLATPEVASALEALLVVAGVPRTPFVPSTPQHLLHARTCYDHMAGTVAVSLHDAMWAQGWLAEGDGSYLVTAVGAQRLRDLGLDLDTMARKRRRQACACMDWSVRRPHLGGALGAGLLQLLLSRGWVTRELDSRALRVSRNGARQLGAAFGVLIEHEPARAATGAAARAA
ncbi:ArsR/SmtB family transcription factor [Bordetella genomosp. 5]|uniref:Transcriptional regulator n=1 Tax=Bordetella genomosp. 5 TaxID=1395608 RepID=A0A261T8Z3_9BORD|nr:helix-turn-helix domain-containing protein [Bordetella genomosp. 5]OZI45771.1 transcriptional regulator [Bordetella genomosp. 5]